MVKTPPSGVGPASSVRGRGGKIPQGSQSKEQNIKRKQYCNKLSKDFKNGPHQKKKNIFKKKMKKEHPSLARVIFILDLVTAHLLLSNS